MSKEIENAVVEIVQGAGVAVSVAFGGATKRDDWECDRWYFTFTRDGREERFEYFTGTGHRKVPNKRLEAEMEREIKSRHSSWRTSIVAKYVKPVEPHMAGVLHSLILDSQAVGQSFDSWCGEFGYETDSRKAYATYQACMENGEKFARLFNAEQREALGNALQDY